MFRTRCIVPLSSNAPEWIPSGSFGVNSKNHKIGLENNLSLDLPKMLK